MQPHAALPKPGAYGSCPNSTNECTALLDKSLTHLSWIVFFFPPAISVGLLFSSHRKTPLWHLTCTLAEGIWLSSCSGAWTKVCYHQHWLCKTSSSTHMFFWISLNYITLHTGFSKGPSLSFSISEQRRVPMVQFIYCSLLTSSHAGHLLSAVQTSHPR